MKQTPVHDSYNLDLLKLIPDNAKNIVECGSSSGALAKAYKEKNKNCNYVGIEIDPEYANLSQRYCDSVITANIEQMDDSTLDQLTEIDCWVFGDVLEHLVDPWAVLEKLKKTLSTNGCVVACIPNMQHWSIQLKLHLGMLQYESMGLLDKTHLRWFTRITIIELFKTTGFKIVAGGPRIFPGKDHDDKLKIIRAMAVAIGSNPDQAVADAAPFQHVIKAIPN